jgi:hypothetical protein
MRSNLSAPSHEGIFYRAEQATDLTTRERQYFFLAIAEANTSSTCVGIAAANCSELRQDLKNCDRTVL